ncbi:hypothetical protein [Streptomyces sp. NPDC003247]|uniref:hypothetical protein n=1 Tax=Streptomyces sp. NPDC003247 TaxID=3364677 RepID=UPI0036913D7E
MTLAHALDGLDARPWSAVSHAYGSAEDLPDLLRALAGADREASDEALSELYGSVLHQGTVYAASAEAVPFLARVAAAGHRTADVLELIGGMAESEDEHGVAPGTVRAAVARELPLLLPLLDAADPGVRGRAAWTVGHTRAVDSALPTLRARWERESDAVVRAELLAALALLDAPLGAATAATVLTAPHPAELRMAAVFAGLDAGLPWSDAHHTTVLALLPTGPLMADRLVLDRREPLAAVVETLLGRDRAADREAAFALLDVALRDDRPEVRAEAVWAADRACTLSRSAPRRLLPALVPPADDDAVVAVASLLGRLGTDAAPAARALAPLAGRDPAQDDDRADRALAALVLIAPREAAPLLARGLGRRPRALDCAAGFRLPTDPRRPFPYDDELLDAVRRRLSRPDLLSGNEPWQLANLLAGWGARAAAALPELCAALPHLAERVAPATAAIASACAPGDRHRERTVAALRATAENGALPVAKALYDLTGEDQALLSCLTRHITGNTRDLGEAVRTAGALGPRAASLVPALRAALSGPQGRAVTPVLDTDTALAEALWRITRDAAPVLSALDSVFARAAQSPWHRWSAVRAARVTALLGAAGRPLTPRLEPLLDDPVQVSAAALALVAVAEPSAPDRAALAAAVVEAAGRGADATAVCEALEALGADALPATHLPRLAALAEGDARVVRSGVEERIIGRDEAFRERARTLLDACRRRQP